ncbi:HNH endonuclease [Aeromonas sanarellii]|uniref:HNH endonuclease n=1 Tax=Aeromonas hydrophila TaxID=644 RepID=UPI0021AAB2FF|nr:HNH endonuclease [Aeromonas hydrophila]
MHISFEALTIGAEYERPQLAVLWGYKSHHAISRGVITPAGTQVVILFVTKEKQETFTQYRDYLEADILHWEGEKLHGSDDRIVNSEKNGDEVHLFFRERHHSSFVYFGRIHLLHHELRTDRPSHFSFRVISVSDVAKTDPFKDVEDSYAELATLDETERLAIIQSRVGQGKFRRNVLNLWGCCAVTGVTDERMLKASHIKPWRVADNEERLDPHNGLALVPNLDTLFDRGLITFDADGLIRTSTSINVNLLIQLGVKEGMRLQKIPARLEKYLKYHRQHVFEGPLPVESGLIGEDIF